MSSIIELITNNPSVVDELKDDSGPAWHLIRNDAQSYVYEQDRSAMSYAEAWDIVSSNKHDVPNLEEIGISSGSVLDAMVQCAIRAEESADMAEMEEDVTRLEAVYDALDLDGFKVWRVETGSCSYGFLPHAYESDGTEDDTVLYHWDDVEGSGPQDVLLVMFGNDRLWLYLKKEDEE